MEIHEWQRDSAVPHVHIISEDVSKQHHVECHGAGLCGSETLSTETGGSHTFHNAEANDDIWTKRWLKSIKNRDKEASVALRDLLNGLLHKNSTKIAGNIENIEKWNSQVWNEVQEIMNMFKRYK